MKTEPLMRSNPFALSILAIAINSASIVTCVAAPVLNNAPDGVSISNDNLTVTQTVDSATIEWDSFNIDRLETVTFIQPDTSSVTLNNIGDTNASSILGKIRSNGQVFLSNPNGFIFGTESNINTGSFLATTSTFMHTDNGLELSSSSNSSITIEEGATLYAKDDGYIALLSRSISNNGTMSTDAQGQIILSTLDTGLIKLPGLNIGIDIAGLTDRDNSDSSITLGSSSLLSATHGTIILSSEDLSSVLNSVINSPASIQAKDLHVKADIIEISGLLNYSSQEVDNLHLSADELLTLSANISGRELNLNLTANNIYIGNKNSTFELGSSGLKSINIETLDSGKTVIYNGLKASNSININSQIEYQNTNTEISDLKFETDTGVTDSSIILHKALVNSASDYTTDLILESNNIDISTVSGFDSVELDAANIYLGGNVLANNAINTQAANNLYLKSDISLSAPSINLDDVKFASLTETGNSPFTLTLDSGEKSSQLYLQHVNDNELIATEESLSSIGGIILKSQFEGTNEVLISGDFSTNRFIAGDDFSQFNLRLTDNLSISGLSEFDSRYTVINGEYEFIASGNAGGSQANVGSIGDSATLSGLSLTNFSNVTLNNDIKTDMNGLTLAANNIWINKSNDTLTLANIANGQISISGNLSSLTTAGTPDPGTYSSISIEAFNGDIKLDSLTNVTNVNIEKIGNGDIQLNGDINVTQNINLSNLGDVTVAQDVTFSSNTFSSIDSHLNGYDTRKNISIYTDNKADLGQISANNITIKGAEDSVKSATELHDDVTAIDVLNFLNTDITLKNSLSLTGNINFLSDATPTVTALSINGPHDLDIHSSNEQIYINNIGLDESLDSLSIEGNAELTFINDPNITEGGRLSLLGNLKFNVGANHVFNSNNGELDFSGTTINGSKTLTFNTGTGNLSLGTIGNDSVIDSLIIHSTGKLNLYGDITLATPSFDLSSLSAIQIYQDMTFGSAELPAMVNFGDATLDGTYSLTLFGDTITLGTIGSNIALQDLTIYSAGDLEFNSDITMVGTADINAASILLNNTITTTGLNINLATEGDLTMSPFSVLKADSGKITLSSNTGNISLGAVNALTDVNIDARGGSILNSIDDYVSNTSTSINVLSENLSLNAFNKIGFDVKSPIVISVQNGGSIKTEANSSIYLANLNSASISSRSRVIDTSIGGEAAALDAYAQFNLSSLNQINTPAVTSNFGLISNLSWQADEEESIRKVKSPISAPPIYHGRKGWRLGY